VLVLMHLERKLHSIRKTIAEITTKLFWFAPLATAQEFFFGPVWLRPAEQSQIPLFNEPP
jgi:hypothetical protein